MSSYDERASTSGSDHDTLNESIIAEAIIDEETPLLLSLARARQHYTNTHPHHTHSQPKEDDGNLPPHIQRTSSGGTLIGSESEEEPLLKPSTSTQTSPTPIPWSQLLILLSLQLAEPLASQIINPFVVEVSTPLSFWTGAVC
jgi:hypothetical protein